MGRGQVKLYAENTTEYGDKGSNKKSILNI